MFERRRIRVVGLARLWCRRSPEGREFEAGFRHPTNEKLIPSTQRSMGTFFEFGKDKERKKGVLGSAFHQLCPRYSGALNPTAPTAIILLETFTFTCKMSYVTSTKFEQKCCGVFLIFRWKEMLT